MKMSEEVAIRGALLIFDTTDCELDRVAFFVKFLWGTACTPRRFVSLSGGHDRDFRAISARKPNEHIG